MSVVLSNPTVARALGLSVGERLWFWESVVMFEYLGDEPVGLSPAAQAIFDSAREDLAAIAADTDAGPNCHSADWIKRERERKGASPLPSSPLNNLLLPISSSGKERERENPILENSTSSCANPRKNRSSHDKNRELRQKAVAYLNQMTGRHFSDSTGEVVRLVNGRAAEGHGIEDFKAVIDDRVREWGDDPRMREYLRPSTLFRASRFPEYLAIAREGEHGGKPDDASRWAAYGSVSATYGEADRG